MKYRNFLSFHLAIVILTIMFASFFTQTVHAQSCGVGTVRGGNGLKTCPGGCNEKDPSCICSTSCSSGGVTVERCSDYGSCSSCVSVVGWGTCADNRT